jgi:hypothetical protein
MKPPSKQLRPRPQKQGRKTRAQANPRLAAQTRKVLGKHYANRYGVK